MNNGEPTFFLGSEELAGPHEPRSCWVGGRIAGPYRDDGIWVTIKPSLVGQPYGLGGTDISRLIFFSRHQGVSLLPVSEWPAHVYILRAIDDSVFEVGRFAKEQTAELAWGILYRTPEEAKAAKIGDGSNF